MEVFLLVPHTVMEIRVPPKKVLPSGTLSQILDLGNFVTASPLSVTTLVDGLVDYTYDGRRVVAVYYMSVNCDSLTPILRLVVDLLYNLIPQLCSS